MTPALTRRALASALALPALASPFVARRAAAAATAISIATGVDPSFSSFYVAKQSGIFARNGLDVRLDTGPSGSAMVALLIQNQIQAAYGAEAAGVLDFNLDPNVVAVAEGSVLEHWLGVVARNVPDMDALRGKRVGVARGTGSETFWLAVVDKLGLKLADYTIVPVEAPEMVAALGRGDIDAYAIWEPWVTRGLAAVPGSKVLRDNVGIIQQRNFIYLNRGWAEKNANAAAAFMRSLIEATDKIKNQRAEAAQDVATFLRMDLSMATNLMGKLGFGIKLDQQSIDALRLAEAQLKSIGKLSKPIDYARFIFPDPLRAAAPDRVNYTLPS
jgi:NitT/TauT family transport system substrate-binding protein